MTLRRICSMEEWKEYKLKDFLLIPIRNGLTKPSSIRGKGVKMIGMKEIFAMDYIRSVDMDRVPVTDKEYESSEILKYDLLFARQSLSLEGAGKCGIVVSVDEPTVFESHLIRLRIDTKKANPFFIYYYYKSSIGKNQIKSLVQQVAAAGIRGKELIELGLKVPHIEKQNQIANILRAIDNKIEVNRQINDNLEQQAQALFKSWFVDFEPFRDQPFVESELGMIPEGWRVVSLDEMTSKFGTGLNPRKNFKLGEGNNYYVTIKNMGNNRVYLDDKCDKVNDEAVEKINKRSKLQKGDLLFSGIGTIGRVALITETPTNWNTSESVFNLHPSEIVSSEFLYILLLSDVFQQYVKLHAQGGVQQGIRMASLKDYKMAIPEYGIMREFDNKVVPLVSLAKSNDDETDRLASLRDTLLPRLMSGELKVNEIENAI